MMVGIAFQCSDAWLAIYLCNNTYGIQMLSGLRQNFLNFGIKHKC